MFGEYVRHLGIALAHEFGIDHDITDIHIS
jgi:hypothetical protein